MELSEKVKKGLEACGADECHGDHAGCPYQPSMLCIMAVCCDALSYIRELEARLAEHERPNKPLTMDEIVAEYGRTVPLGIDCAYVVEFREEGYVTRCLIDRMGSIVVATWNCDAEENLFEKDYGKTWRCWSRRPTDEERKAAEWDD